MAYIGNTAGLCQAIVDNDFEEVKRWLADGDFDVNRRDHTGRTPLHLACVVSAPEIVQHLVDNGARLIARVADGRTALHLAAGRGSVEIVRILLTKSEQNEEEETRKEDARKNASKTKEDNASQEDSDEEMVDIPSGDDDDDMYAHSNTTGSFVKVKKDEGQEAESIVPDDAGDLDPDIYDVNVVAWDNKASPLHLAILKGHVAVVEELVSSFGADVLLPVKLVHSYNNSPRAAILTLVLALRLPKESGKAMVEKLLQVGASPAQADIRHKTALHYLSHYGHPEILSIFSKYDKPAVDRAINHLTAVDPYQRYKADTPLTYAISIKDRTKIMKLLEMGSHPAISLEDYVKATEASDKWWTTNQSIEQYKARLEESIVQPVISSLDKDMPLITIELLARGADPNTLTLDGYKVLHDDYSRTSIVGTSLLDYVHAKLKGLRGYDGEKAISPPARLNPDDSAYLDSFNDGSYQMWVAKEILRQRREQLARQQKTYDEEATSRGRTEGLTKKKAVIQTVLTEYEKLEADLLSRGAKTFSELHPDIHGPVYPPLDQFSYKPKVQPYEITLDFRAQNCTDERKEGYFQL